MSPGGTGRVRFLPVSPNVADTLTPPVTLPSTHRHIKKKISFHNNNNISPSPTHSIPSTHFPTTTTTTNNSKKPSPKNGPSTPKKEKQKLNPQEIQAQKPAHLQSPPERERPHRCELVGLPRFPHFLLPN